MTNLKIIECRINRDGYIFDKEKEMWIKSDLNE